MKSEDFEEELVLPPKKFGPRPELTAKQKLELNLAFGKFDPRGIGLIDARGFILAQRAMGYEPKIAQAENMIVEVIGGDNPETLDFKDFYRLMRAKMIGDDSKADVQKMFKMFSSPDTGVISLDNLKAIATELEEDVSMDELQEMISFADTNKDGVVSFDEFVKIMDRPELE